MNHLAAVLVRERITHQQDRHYTAALDAERRRTSQARELERLVAAAADGDQSAWSALVVRYRGRVLRVSRAHGLDAQQVDDVAQETWLRLYRNVTRVRDPHALGAWIETTARRESLRALKGRRREDLTDQEIGAERTEPEVPDDDLLQERREALQAAIARLPERQRRLIETLIAEPCPSYADAAEQLGLPIGSIGPTRGRCIQRLRLVLDAEGARS